MDKKYKYIKRLKKRVRVQLDFENYDQAKETIDLIKKEVGYEYLNGGGGQVTGGKLI